MNINNWLMFMRLFNRTIGAMSLHTSLSRPSKLKVYIKKDKALGKPKILVWKGMTIKDLVKALNRSGSDVMEAVGRVLSSSQKLTYSTEIHDMYVLSAVAKLCGRSIRERVVEKEVIIVDKDVYNRNIYLNPERLKPRPPVVTIMGHVDHGKTTLIDSLRSSRIVDSEFGGITQHIGAFKVKLSDISGKGNVNSSNDIVTFLDTPGHAAFSSMRCRGAHCTDIVILVVSVDDGIMPQTLESIRFAKEAKVPIIVVMNKVDRLFSTIAEVNMPANKRTFDPIRHSLSKHGVVVEELGGDVQCLPISALKKWNLDLLQESVLALSEIIGIRCDYEGACEGVVLEARNVEHFGKVATVLVQQGTMKLGTILVAGHSFARVRTLRSDDGKSIKEALPGDPIEVTGWRETLPCAGDSVIEVGTESRANEVLHYRKTLIDHEKSERDYKAYAATMEAYKASYKEYINEGFKKGFRLWKERPELSDFIQSANIVNGVEVPQINLVIKTDVQGSLEAIEDVLAVATASCSDQCVLKIARIGVGNLTENDMELAAGCNAVVYLFNLPGSLSVTRSLAIDVRHFNVIYHMFDNLRDEISAKLPTTNELEVIGEAEVLQMFDIREKKVKVSVIGCKCFSGMLVRSKDQYYYRVMRQRLSNLSDSSNINDMEVIKTELTCKSLRHLRSDVETIRRGVECGIVLVDKNGETFPVNEGDILQCYKTISLKQKLNWNLGFQ